MKLTNFFATRMLAISVMAGLGVFVCEPVLALDAPSQSQKDHRVRYTNYDPANVIQLDAVIGVATHIVLEKGENYVYHVFGDSEAYEFTYKNNHLFFKPSAEDADSNLIVVTDRRDYAFRISYSSNRNSRALYKLVIRYPESEAKAAKKQAQEELIKNSLQAAGSPKNWQSYTRSGDVAIAPVHAWDDGRQTWLQFAYEADIPTVYRVTPDGQEVITNYHMADARTMVLHRTAKKWHLRLGNLVTAVHNEAYGLIEPPTHTGTASPEVKRTVKGASPQVLPSAYQNQVGEVNALEHYNTDSAIAKEAKPVPVDSVQIHQAQTGEAVSSYDNIHVVKGTKPVAPIHASSLGDLSLQPVKMWEDQGMTWLQLPENAKVPNVYAVDKSNKRVKKATTLYTENVIAVDGISDTWQLQLDDAILTINKDFEK